MKNVLVINPGSSSKKYALYQGTKLALDIRFEETNGGFEMCSIQADRQQTSEAVDQTTFDSAFKRVAEAVKASLEESQQTLAAIVVRMVAPGTVFQRHQTLDRELIQKLEQHQSSAPLHVPTILQDVRFAAEAFPEAKMIAASDSAFHATMPTTAREFSIDRSDASTHDIHRFGYHGLSVASTIRRIHPVTGLNPEKVIVCHIGGGVSVTAVRDGQSIDTTLGYSPTSGLPMGSRAGELDPGALLELIRAKNLKPSEAAMYIHTKGGLAGLSGESDIRRLLDLRSKGDLLAKETLSHFVYHIQKAIVSMTVPLEGLDMVVLTGTAASRSSELRSLIFNGLKHLGIQIDNDRNNTLFSSDGVLSAAASDIKVVVMRTDEMGEMAWLANSFNKNVSLADLQ